MGDAKETLFRECGEKNINWDTVNQCVADLGASINDMDDLDETLLSKVIKECGSADTESPRLVRLIQIFLDHGYDPNANDRFNGGVCLHALCWSTYTSEILDAAELLLDEGADPFFDLEDEAENKGVLNSISWKLGYWTDGDLSCANLFEAYYAMITAAQNGENYHGIHTVSKCKGKTIRKIERLSLSNIDIAFNQPSDCFKGAYVIWCEDDPLIISQDVDFVVNPLIPPKAVKREDRSEAFSQIIGKAIDNLTFLSANIAELHFDDGSCMLFGNNYMGSNDDYYARVEYRNTFGSKLPEIEKVNQVFFRSGISYSDSCRRYTEDMVFLDCGESYYLVCSIGEDYSEHELVCRKFSKEWFSGLSRTLKYDGFCFDRFIMSKDGTLNGLQLHSDTKILYLITTEFSEIKVMLESEPIKSIELIHYYSEGSKIEFAYRESNNV